MFGRSPQGFFDQPEPKLYGMALGPRSLAFNPEFLHSAKNSCIVYLQKLWHNVGHQSEPHFRR